MKKITNCKKGEDTFNFKGADFVALNNYFKEIELTSIMTDMDANRSFECFYDTINCAFNQIVPKIKIRKKNTRPWYNSDLKKLRNARNKEYKKKKNKLPNNLTAVKRAFDELNKKLYDEHNKKVARNVKKDPKKFWTYVNEQKNQKN